MDLAGAYPYHFALGSHGRRALDRLGGSITALATPFRADALDLEVQDDGRGLTGQPGLGLTGMHERLGALGGDIRIDNAATGGVRLAVRLPLEQVAR